ncbi:MAG: hypothetical protein U0M60_20405 [Clostridia bacterium]|nr:hypothetical protein [Clostridia bacterium]
MNKKDSCVNSKIYLAYNKDGFLCAFDSNTHKCIGIITATGDKLLSKEEEKAIIGTLDPKFIV